MITSAPTPTRRTRPILESSDWDGSRAGMADSRQSARQQRRRRSVGIDKTGWDEFEGRYKASHPESREKFLLDVTLVENVEDKAENPDAATEDRKIEKIHFEIQFEFAFSETEAELANIGVLVSKLRPALKETITGKPSSAVIILHNVGGDMQLNEWVHSEGLKASLRLWGEDDRVDSTEIEFFENYIEVMPPYYEIDREVTRYIEFLAKNYILLSNDSPANSETS